MLKDYHLIRDKGSANYYIHPNKVTTSLGQKKANPRFYMHMKERKPIDTFVQINDSRFDIIEKSPRVLTNVKKVTGLSFQGYDKRGGLFPEQDIATFYDSNKEATMKGLRAGALPWRKMTSKPTSMTVTTETPENCYDYGKAIEVKTTRTKPRLIGLANFSKQTARDDMLLKTSDAYSNVLLENSKDERETEIEAKKESQKRYLGAGIF